MRRLFIAIDLPNNVIDDIEKRISILRQKIIGKFVKKENLHITLLFLGDTKLEIEKIIAVLKGIDFNRKIELNGAGAFPSFNHASVLFIDVKTDLSDIYYNLCKLLDVKIVENFHPHITVCRLNDESLDTESYAALSNMNEEFSAKKLSLFNSDLKRYYRLF
jgi:2'-5' RNA ligase